MAKASATTAVGRVSVQVDLSQHSIHVKGLRGLQSHPVRYTGLEVVGANSKALDVRFSLHLHNPSESIKVSMLDSDLSMAAFFRGSYVCRAFVAKQRFDFPSGPLELKDVRFAYEPSADEHIEVL